MIFIFDCVILQTSHYFLKPPVNQRLTNSVYKTQFYIVNGHAMQSIQHVLGLCFIQIYFFCVGYSPSPPPPSKKDNRCRITPLPPHNRPLSKTVTLLCLQSGRVAGRFDCGFMQDTIYNQGLAYGSYARSTSGSQNLAVLPKRHDNSLSLLN